MGFCCCSDYLVLEHSKVISLSWMTLAMPLTLNLAALCRDLCAPLTHCLALGLYVCKASLCNQAFNSLRA